MLAARQNKTCVSLSAAILTILFSLAAFSQSSGAASEPGIAEMSRLFANPPDDCRIMMRWWWFGPAVTKPELEREMTRMKQGGIGGFEVQPVYPVALDDAAAGIRNLPYLSDEFMNALRFTSEKARELGLRMDLTIGSGWPYGGPQVPVADAAGKLRIVRTRIPEGARRLPVPSIGAGEKLIAAFLVVRHDETHREFRDLGDIGDSAVEIPGETKAQEVIFFISSRTGMMVKRPAVGAEGFVLNHYDRAAVERYLKNVGDRLLQALRPNPPYAIFCDSLEVYESDWTDDFMEEFRKRRGYDLRSALPALALDIDSMTAAVRHDWGKTLTELFNEHFMVPMREWAQKNRTLFRVQGYGIPPATIASNAYADISEGEGSQWKVVRASRWASSANHLFGRAVTTSETWTWLHSPSFRATPLDMKAEANLHFLQGVNQLIGHGWPYTPQSEEYPGWRFYAAGVFNDKNPWWIVMPDLARYLQRDSYLLRQGQPANDIAFYLPVSDAYASFSPGRANLIDSLRDRVGPDAIPAVLSAGFNLDFFDDDVLKQIGRIENGALVLGANRYQAVVLPNTSRIPMETLRTLAAFVRSGGALIASRSRPGTPPSFRDSDAEADERARLSRELFSPSAARSRFIENEKTQLGAALRSLLQPDVEWSPEAPEVGFVHRRTADAEIYFLANTSNSHQAATASFRVGGMQAEWWDPLSGRITPAETRRERKGITSVTVELEPYDARFLVFSKRAAEPGIEAHAAGKPVEIAQLDLSNGWRVVFGKGVPDATMGRLSSWTDAEASRYFSGVATYTKSFSVPESMLSPGVSVRLDLGEGQALAEIPGRSSGMRAWYEGPVREAAFIVINDQSAGPIWCPPYTVDVTKRLRRGENWIRIFVANTAVNHMAGRALPDYRLLNLRYGTRFEPQDMDKVQPIPSGLLGPVRLIAESASPSQARPVHVFMIGDSTMADKTPATEPERGWGQMLQSFFKDSVKVVNYAQNGRSSKSFIDEGLWKAVLDDLQAGDYVIIQFGHNDQKPDAARHTDPDTTYTGNLEKYIREARAKGAFPILCTSIVRRKFDEKGTLTDTHGQYPDAVRAVAREFKVPLLDLQLKTQKLVADLGPEKSKSLYLYAARGAYPNRPEGVQDDTHLCVEGATTVARMAVEEMRALKLPLAGHLQ